MVRLLLSIKADLENVTDLQPATDDFEYFFQVKCTQCNEIHPKTIGINRHEEYEVAGGRGGMANFVWKCGTCKREASARNLEFIGLDPKGTWKCVGVETGTVFEDVELDDGEWIDYDEKSKLPVGVSNVEGEWTRA